MTLINLRNLGVTMSTPLFSNISLTVGAGDRIGLVAANGRGKSTLLRCLAGTQEPTSGDITRSRGLRIGHVEQDIPDPWMAIPMQQLVCDALPEEQRASDSWRVDVTLDALEVPEILRNRTLAELSGGWRRLALIARTWVSEPDLLMLDEPTNHLDLGKINLLERWLSALPRDVPVILSSHDRTFLDAATNRTFFLRPENSCFFALPYGRARTALAEADAADTRRFERDMKDAQQLRRQAAKLNNIGINSGSDLLVVKTKQLKQRAEKLEDAARPAHLERSAGAIKLTNRGTHAKTLLKLEDLAVTTPDGILLFKIAKLWVNQGDRIVLLGRNGTGKSRLIGLIKAAIDGAETPIRVTPSLVLGYSGQNLSELGETETPMSALCRRFEIGDQRARGLLATAGIGILVQEKPIAFLSGGQRARLAMLALRLTNPNFYLLDEPTNHLDIEGQEMLESELLAHGTSSLLASHDRSFVRGVGNRFWQIDKKRLIEVDGPEEFFASASQDPG